MQNQFKTYDLLKKEQEKSLKIIINYAYKNVPYYHNLFKSLRIKTDEIKKIEDLQKLPILTKEIIKEHWNEFKPINLNNIKYYESSTGGTMGTPFYYRLDRSNRFLAWILKYRGWNYAGYNLGDPTLFFGGASLRIIKKQKLYKKIEDRFRNIRRLSSFDMDTNSFEEYIKEINLFKPKYIYGYPSALYFFAKWIQNNWDGEVYAPQGIFTTSEKLYEHMRKKIEDVFSTEVFDNYGLNDGGVSAYECKEHQGLHIDTERAVMEVVDKNNMAIEEGEGKILATSLYNFSLPFIRYDTGDMAYILSETDRCSCGRGHRLLKDVLGRAVDIFITPQGKYIHGWFFLYIFWEYGKGIKKYKVIQKKLDYILIKIVPDDNFDKNNLNIIYNLIKKRSPEWNIEFKIVDKISLTSAGKYKFIVNELIEK